MAPRTDTTSPAAQPARLTRRALLQGTAAAAAAAAGGTGSLRVGLAAQARTAEDAPVEIGNRRELFVDNALQATREGAAEVRLGRPEPKQRILVHDAPWEGTGSGYHSVFQDGPLYRMYYKAWHIQVGGGRVNTGRHPLYCCYAESDDGKRWRKPELGLHEFAGSKRNNITITSGKLGALSVDAGHPAVFKDDNPDAPASSRYKAIVRSSGKSGLIPFESPDGLNWTPMTDAPILSGLGAFDSQNLAFWDPNIGKYRAYWRIFSNGIRAIRTATSDDLVHWDRWVDVTYEDSPAEHLYTNQVKPYWRAPHLLLGFPTRYVDRGWTESTRALPEREAREARAAASRRYGTAITEGLFMASRDGLAFRRWNEAFLRPGIERTGSWNYGHQYLAWHPVETASDLPGAPNEISLYASEDYWTGESSAVRRYTLRLDGFASLAAPMAGGWWTSKVIVPTGQQLHLNFASSAAGGVQVELQSAEGQPLPGYALDDCHMLFGDAIDRPVRWKNQATLGALAGKPLRLKLFLRDADVYSFQFA